MAAGGLQLTTFLYQFHDDINAYCGPKEINKHITFPVVYECHARFMMNNNVELPSVGLSRFCFKYEKLMSAMNLERRLKLTIQRKMTVLVIALVKTHFIPI